MVEELLPNTSVLVTGASGFIGCYLSKLLKKEGIDVRPCGRAANPQEQTRKAELEACGMKYLEVDLTEASQARRTVQGVSAVIHLAAAQHEAGKPEDFFHTVNVGGTRNLLDAAVVAGVERFIYGSTIGVFGVGGPDPLNEQSPLAPNNAYGRSKAAAEDIVNSYTKRIRTTIIRISETYGEGDYRLLKLFRAAEKKSLIQIGDSSNLHQPIHVDDLARGFQTTLAQKNTAGKTYILAGNERITTRQMLDAVDDALHAGARTIRIPLGPMLAACIVCESVFGAVGMTPPLHRRRLEFFTKNLIFDVTRSQDELGFAPRVSFADGCRRTAGWYRSKGLIS